MKCIVCENEIKQLEQSDNKSPLETRMFNDGVVDTITCGYGSRFDMNTYRFGICDNCLENKAKSGTIDKLTKEELLIRREFFRILLRKK